MTVYIDDVDQIVEPPREFDRDAESLLKEAGVAHLNTTVTA
jgi:hypothetical protein